MTNSPDPPLLADQPPGYRSLRQLLSWEEISFVVEPTADPRTAAATIAHFLQFASQTATAVYEMHRQQIQHGALTPAAILIPAADTAVANGQTPIRLRYPPPDGAAPRQPLERLAYIAPEQTERMRDAPDQRADLYALGVIFYQLLTGQLPFTAAEPAALIHAHLAFLPTPPADHNPAIPRPLSDLVMKLLAKDRRRRYQSAAGLRRELEACLTLWRATGDLASFTVGEMDIPDRLMLPSRLYGRRAEWAQTEQAWATAVAGQTQRLIIEGATGMGKSEWAQPLAPLAHSGGGWLLAYRPEQEAPAFTAVIGLLNQLIQQLLSLPLDELAWWRERLRPALRGRLTLLRPHLPYVDRLADPAVQGQMAGAPASAVSDQSVLLQLALHDLLQTIFAARQPLIIFLDDAPDADPESRQLLRSLTAPPDLPLLFIIAVNSGKPLPPDWDAFIAPPPDRLLLVPLTPADVGQLLAEALHAPANERLDELAGALHAKTGGNPFFVRHYLTALYARGWLAFNPDAHQWEWDLDQIAAHPVSDNVAELGQERLQFLPAAAQKTLKIAAWLGRQFPTDWVAAICQQSPVITGHHLQMALEEGLLVGLNAEGRPLATMADDDLDLLREPRRLGLAEAGQQLTDPDRSAPPHPDDSLATAVPPPDYQFAHEQLRRAAQQLRPDFPETAVRAQIGQALWRLQPPPPPHLIAVHLNAANPADFTADQRARIADLNLQASRAAQTKVAYDHGLAFALRGLAWLGEERGREGELWAALHLAGAQAATRAGAFAETERLLDRLTAQSASIWERVEAARARIFAFYLRGQHEAAVRVALAILPELGLRLLPWAGQSATAARLALGWRLTQVELALRGDPAAALARLPAMDDRRLSAAMEIMAAATISAAAVNPQLLILMGLEMVWQTARRGKHPLSALGCAIYGVLLCGVLGRIERGYAFGQIALQLAPAVAAKELRGFIAYFVHAHIAHWRDPIADTLQPLRDLPDSGHYEYLALAAGLYPYLTWFINRQEIAFSEQAIADNMYLLEPFRDTPLFYRYQMGQQFYQNLLGWTDNPARLAGAVYDAPRLLPRHIAEADRTTLFYVAAHQLILAYLFGDLAAAEQAAQLANAYADGGVGTPLIPVVCFYDSLTALGRPPLGLSKGVGFDKLNQRLKQRLNQGAVWRRVQKNQRRLAGWAAHSPANCLHRHTLVAAELARSQGRNGRARELYDLAIAQAQEFLPELALAQELAANFYEGIGQPAYAGQQARAAWRNYQKWGAAGKVQQIERRFAHYFTASADGPSADGASDVTGWQNLARTAAAVDGATVMEAARLLTRQMTLPDLLAQLTALFKKNAGAQAAYLLLPQGDDWQIVVNDGGTVASDGGTAAIDMEAARQAARTGKPLARSRAGFTSAGQSETAVSILCLPLMERGELVGLLYLENRLTGGLFQTELLPTLTILAEMAAVSIKNSLLTARLRSAHWQSEAKELAAIEQERQRIAQEIHDGVAQDMAFLRLKVALWRDWIADSPERMSQELDEATQTLDGAILDIRRAIYALRPLPLEKEGLSAALEGMVADLNEQYDLQVTLRLEPPAMQLPRELELPLYRAAQESLNNIVQHAQATQAWVTLALMDGGVCLTIRDNGVGFTVTAVDANAKEANPRFGLRQMRERIEQAQGTFAVVSQPGAGSETRVWLPLAD